MNNKKQTAKRKLPVIWRMTFINMAVLFCVIAFFVTGFTTALLYEVSSTKVKQMDEVTQAIEDKLSKADELTNDYLSAIRIKNGMKFSLYNQDCKCIFASIEGLSVPSFSSIKAEISYTGQRNPNEEGPDAYEFIIQSGDWINIHGQPLYLYVYRDVTDEVEIVEKVPYILIATVVFGLIVSFFAGRMMSKHMLKPIKDISARMKDISVHNLNERLPESTSMDELQELSQSFNKMIERLEQSFTRQKQFVSDASHELLTPLAVMKGHTSMLQRWGKEDKVVIDSSLKTMQYEIHDMTELINQLLVLAKNDDASIILHKEGIKADIFFNEIVDEVRLINPESNIRITCGVNTIYADRSALKQVLHILLENSIKFCPPPGKIEIQATRWQTGILISVADEGIGIEKDKLPFVFERFFRADSSRTRNTGGTGLGLSIAKSIVESHGGTINIESQSGKGTVIQVWLKSFM